MKTNIGKIDRLIRIFLAGFLSLLFLQGSIIGIWSILAITAAAILVITAIVGTCPIYSLLNTNTIKRN